MVRFVKASRAGTRRSDIWINADQVLYVGPSLDGGTSVCFNAPADGGGFLVVRVEGDPETLAERLRGDP